MDQSHSIHPVVGGVMFLIWLVCAVAMVWAYVRIVQKAGFSGWYLLWMLVPIANIIVFFRFAFGRWPIEDRIADLESKVF